MRTTKWMVALAVAAMGVAAPVSAQQQPQFPQQQPQFPQQQPQFPQQQPQFPQQQPQIPQPQPGETPAPQLENEARQLCTIAIGALAFGQYPTQQVLGQGALQVAMQQTNGTGVYQQLKQLGQLNSVQIVNPHFDQDQQFGRLFHFYCMASFQSGALNWELKYAPSTDKIEFYGITPANTQPQQQPRQPQFPQQQPQQPQFPQQQPQFPQQQPQQQPQFPQQQPQQQPQFPQQQPQQNPNQPQTNPQSPSRDEACKMFPGMC